MKIKIGMDPEFMVFYKGQPIYPVLRDANTCIPKPSKARDRVISALDKVDYDEFGHCCEIRPAEAESGEKLMYNVMTEMAKLPGDFKYHTFNAYWLDKKLVTKMIRLTGRKDVSQSKNIYGNDVLDDCEEDLKAAKAGQKILFCGCHMHVSATKEVVINEVIDGRTEIHRKEESIPLPTEVLTLLFDRLIFSQLDSDKNFKIGRYRSPGFYEEKHHGGFEYRSLGASALTPKRVYLIAEAMIAIVRETMKIHGAAFTALMLQTYTRDDIVNTMWDRTKHILNELVKTKPITGNIQKIWTPHL
jgi:hypothetical protein